MPARSWQRRKKAREDADAFSRTLREYEALQRDSPEARALRSSKYGQLVDDYYDLVTDLYERNWGQSFHFAPRFAGETRRESLVRHEHYLALRLGLRPGMRVLDVGCGVGGPMRNIARFANVNVSGITINEGQVRRGRDHNAKARLSSQCQMVVGDFMDIPCQDASFDAAFAIEATCHAPDRSRVFTEVFRVMHPGASFAGYEWCLTETYDPEDRTHVSLKRLVEQANGLPELTSADAVGDALTASGFEILETRDLANAGDPETPWHKPLTTPESGVGRILASRPGRRLMHRTTGLLEFLRVAPHGLSEVYALLESGGRALAESGRMGIFSPAYFFLARKPQAGAGPASVG